MKHGSRHRITEGLLILGCSLALGCDDPATSNRVTPPISPQTTVTQPLATDAFNRPNENPIAGNWTSAPGVAANLQLLNNAVKAVAEARKTRGRI